MKTRGSLALAIMAGVASLGTGVPSLGGEIASGMNAISFHYTEPSQKPVPAAPGAKQAKVQKQSGRSPETPQWRRPKRGGRLGWSVAEGKRRARRSRNQKRHKANLGR